MRTMNPRCEHIAQVVTLERKHSLQHQRVGDPLGTVRGVINGIILGLAAWLLIFGFAWMVR